jgi:hypothetical protein
MAEFHFLKGTFKGRLGDVVFSSWKGIDYVKTYTKPGNPRTAGQTGHRAVFSRLAHLGKGLNEAVLKPFTFPKPQKKSPYNAFIENNIELLQANLWNIAKLQILNGSLPLDPSKNPIWDAANKTVGFEWEQNAGTPAKSTDVAICVLIQADKVIGIGTVENRAALGYGWTANSAPELMNGPAHIFLAFAQPPTAGTNEPGIVSNTSYATVNITGLPRSLSAEPATPDTPSKNEEETEKKT